MSRILFACAFSAVMIATASAQTVNRGRSTPAAQAYMRAMQDMDDVMKSMTPSGDPNTDFVMIMIPHHQAAVDMAEAYLKYGKDPLLTQMAKNIIASQKKEIKEMTAWQAKHRM